MSENVVLAIIGGAVTLAVTVIQIAGIRLNSKQHGESAAKLDRIDSRLETIDGRLSTVEGRLASVEGRTAVLEGVKVTQYGAPAVVEPAEA